MALSFWSRISYIYEKKIERQLHWDISQSSHDLISHCEQQEEKDDNLVFVVLFVSGFFGLVKYHPTRQDDTNNLGI